MKFTALEAAYMAGLFDRGGGVFIYSQPSRTPGASPIYKLEIVINLKARAPLDEFQTKLGAGKVQTTTNSFRWKLYNRDAWDFLLEIDEYVRVRTKELDAARIYFRYYTRVRGRQSSLTQSELNGRERARMMLSRRTRNEIRPDPS